MAALGGAQTEDAESLQTGQARRLDPHAVGHETEFPGSDATVAHLSAELQGGLPSKTVILSASSFRVML